MEERKILTVEELEESVKNVARKYSRKTNLSQQDFEQELWLFLCEKKFDNLALARTCLVNRAKSICFKEWKNMENLTDFESPLGELYVNSNSNKMSRNGYDDLILEDLVKDLPERERKFVIAKAYLIEGFECFEEEFYRMVKELDAEKLEMLLNAPKIFSDDTILRVFCGIKTGSNSGTARVLKGNLKKIFCVA